MHSPLFLSTNPQLTQLIPSPHYYSFPSLHPSISLSLSLFTIISLIHSYKILITTTIIKSYHILLGVINSSLLTHSTHSYAINVIISTSLNLTPWYVPSYSTEFIISFVNQHWCRRTSVVMEPSFSHNQIPCHMGEEWNQTYSWPVFKWQW